MILIAKKSNRRAVLSAGLVFIACIVYVLNVNTSQALECQLDNVALQSMPDVEIKFELPTGGSLKIKAKLADNARTRAAGFQRVCASTIEKSPILFVFERESLPRFHMRNVVAPIDIAFIKQGGEIDSIQSMAIYVLASRSRPLYSPRQAVIAALEVSPEFYTKHGVDVNTKVSWVKY